MTKKKQDIRLAITLKGEEYLRELVEKGYANLPSWEQRTEWDILQDLMSLGVSSDGAKLGELLAVRPTTILGRKFETFSEHGERGQLAEESYGRTLRRLIKEGYIKAWVHQPEKKVEEG